MKKIILLFSLIILFTSTVVFAQVEQKYGNPNDTNLPDYAREMYKENPDYGKVIDMYEAYYKTHKLVKNTHTQYYKRLIHELTEDPYGIQFGLMTREQANLVNKEYLQRIENSSMKGSRAVWSCIGPFDFDKDANSRSYAPGAAHMYTVEQSQSNPNVLYAGGATSGLWKTIDKGAHWNLLTRNFAFNTVYALEIDYTNENIMYFGAGSAMYKTTDGGTTITQIGDAAFQSAPHGTFREIMMDPANTSIVWALSDAGLYKTIDAGANWIQVMSGHFKEMEYHPTVNTTLYTVREISDTTEFYKSIDGGVTWVKKTNGWPAPSTQGQPAECKRAELAVTPAAPDMVFAYVTGGANGGSGTYGVYVSSDAGETWNFQCCGTQPAGPPDPATNPNLMGWSDDGSDDGGQYYYDVAFAVSPTNADSVYVGGVNMWYSSDGGANFTCPAKWSHPYKPNYIHADLHDIKIYGKDIWMACDGGIFYSNDGCQNITKQMFGISGTDFWGFGAGYSNGDVMIGGAYHNGTQLRDENVYINGWVCIQGGDNTRGMVDPYNDRIVYDDGGRKQLSGDRNQNILNLPYSLSSSTKSNLEFDWDNSQTVYSGLGTQLRKSTDLGATYSIVHDFGVTLGRIKVAPSNSNIIVVATFAGTYDTKNIYRSIDGGSAWTDITPSSATLDGYIYIPYDFEIDENNPDIIYLARIPNLTYSSWLKDGYKVFKTTDGGNSWTNITSPDLDGEFITNIAYQHGTNGGLYLGTRRAVYYKNNSMSNWALYSTGLPALTYSRQIEIDYHNGRVLNGTNHSVYAADLYEPSAVKANFAVDKNSVFCARDTIYFVDHSTVLQAGATWSWSFPGAAYVSSTSVKNPKVVYGTAGTYSVSMTVTDAGSNSDTKSKTDFIVIAAECDPETVPGNALDNPGGSNDYVVAPPLNITSNTMTFSAWIKRNGDQNDWAGLIFSRGGSLGAAGLNFGTNNELRHHWNGGDWGWNSGLVVPDGVWTHVALVIEPTKATIYMNGEPAVHNSAKDPKTFDVDLNIGGDAGYASRKFKGLMDEVCIYNASLTQEQIRDLMYKTKDPASIPNLIHYYQFNRASGTITDRVALAHASLQGNATRTNSTAPVPYNSIADGNWSDSTTWNTGQNAPVKDWARVKVENNVNLDQNQTLKSLEITPTGKLTVNAAQQLTMDGTDLTNNSGTDGLVLKADATGTASLLHNTNNVDATVESYISQDKWHFVSAPVNNAQTDVFTDMYLMSFDETDYTWHYITSLNYDLTEGRSFTAWSQSGTTGNATVNYSGVLNNGDLTVNGLSYTASQPEANRGWNMVGNPYPSAIHLNNSWTRTNVDATAYIYDGANYLTWNLATNSGTHANGDVAVGQGFWVKANAAGASITIPQSERKHSTQQFYKANRQLSQLLLTVEGNGYFDKMIVEFNNEATAGFDSELDAWKFKGRQEAPQLYSVSQENNLTVNVLPFEDQTMIIPVNFEAGVENNYTITASGIDNFDEYTAIWIEDLKDNKMVDLRQNPSYTFDAKPDDTPNRFLLHFKKSAFGTEEHSSEGFNIYSYGKRVYVIVPTLTKGNIKVYNLMGQEIKNVSINSTITTITLNKSAYYVVVAKGDKTVTNKKVFIE